MPFQGKGGMCHCVPALSSTYPPALAACTCRSARAPVSHLELSHTNTPLLPHPPTLPACCLHIVPPPPSYSRPPSAQCLILCCPRFLSLFVLWPVSLLCFMRLFAMLSREALVCARSSSQLFFQFALTGPSSKGSL